MGHKVRWTQLARIQLFEVFSYYEPLSGVASAHRLVQNIDSATDILKHSPFAGQIEYELEDYPQGFRYLVEGNYKILYCVEQESVTIAAVFNCRQNPTKMREMFKP